VTAPLRAGGRRGAPPRALVLIAGAAMALAWVPANADGAAEAAPRTASIAVSSARAEVEALLARLGDAIRARDVKGALSLYSFADSSDAARKRDEFGAIAALDSMTADLRPAQVTVRGDRASAVALSTIRYREHGRDQAQVAWLFYALRKAAGRWTIVSSDDREYAQAAFTDLHVRLEPDSSRMSGVARIRIGIHDGGPDCLLLGLNRGLDVRDVSGDAGEPGGSGVPWTWLRLADVVAVSLPGGKSVSSGDSVTVTVTFEGILFNESQELGYSQVGIAPGGCFASWVTSWYPHVLGTGSKSRGRLAFDVPAGYTVAASGRPDSTRAVGNHEEAVFLVQRRVDFSFAAARYFHREQTVAGVPIGVYFLSGGERKADFYESQCAKILAFERDLYGMYPFDGYALVEIPATAVGNLGGSSEQGMNLFPVGMLPDSVLPLPLLAHEMGHSWWGNYIESDDGPIVSEGLAQLTAVLCIQSLEGDEAMRRFLKYGRPDYPQSASLYFRAFAPDSASDLPLATPSMRTSARGVLHDLADVKGHFVYEMLREEIGDGPFVSALRQIVATRGNLSVKLRDLRAGWEKASGRNLGAFFRQWFYRPGAPALALRDSVVVRRGKLILEGSVRQTRDLFRAPVEIVAVTDRGPIVRRVEVADRETPFAFTLPGRPEIVLLDPDYKLLSWLPEFEDGLLMQRVASLRGLGRQEIALPMLNAYLDSIPDAMDALYQVGLCLQERGDPAGAERRYRRVADRYDLYPSYAPVVPLSFLHLGEVCDLQGRRSEAIEYYRRVASLPDVADSRAEAEARLQRPYVTPPSSPPPSDDVLRSYVGTYVGAPVGEVEVEYTEYGLEAKTSPSKLRTYLTWMHGSRFRAAARESITLEFVRGGDRTTGLTLHSPRGDFLLTRRE
jgi:tetratricopeptide (TPR) repeat protein/ketosteroid isomerase-like protein